MSLFCFRNSFRHELTVLEKVRHCTIDRISIPTRDLPQAIPVYCWWLARDWARGTTGRRVHGVGKQTSSGSGFP
jgi:hypothetical protein